MCLPEMGYEILKHFVDGEIDTLKLIIEHTLSFDLPLSKIKKGVYALELFHAPTLAFKDIKARFLARCLSYFTVNEKQLTILQPPPAILVAPLQMVFSIFQELTL